MRLIDTHTHFDLPIYDDKQEMYLMRAAQAGVRHLVLIGYQACYFDRLVDTALAINTKALNTKPHAHLAMGLHPLYIQNHSEQDLALLDDYLNRYRTIAIGEIGLDTYPTELKEASIYAKQQRFFIAQLALAKAHHLPVMLHIRRSHADVLRLLKHERFTGGGIAHSFSGGEQEAFALIKLGFKIGVTGQITNPNAKKLHRTIKAVLAKFGTTALVIETDCPDMTPLPCQHLPINEPATLIHVLDALSQLSGIDKTTLATQLWDNTIQALGDYFD